MSTFLTGYPVTKAKLDEFLALIEAGENIASLWMPMSARTDFAIQLQTKAGIPELLASKLTFVYLDLSLSQEFVERQLEESLERYSTKTGIRNKLIDIVGSEQRIVLILDNFSLKNIEWTKYIFSLRHEVPHKTITYLLLAFESEFYETKTREPDFGLVYHNLLKVPYLTKTEVMDWIETQDSTLSQKDKEKIFTFCGGIYGLLINFFRAYRKYKTVDLALESEQLRNTVEHLWGRFSDRERHILKSICKFGRVPPYAFELNYLREHNLLTPDNKILGDWVKLVVGQDQEVEVALKDDQILWQGTVLNELFTHKELELLRGLFKTTDTMTRDDAAKILWGRQVAEKYSDWAIDQTFSRLRRKFETVGLGSDKIKTLKGRGFKLTGVKVV